MEMGTSSRKIKQMSAPVEHDFMLKGKEVVLEKPSFEWNLNEWKWDGNLFVAERRVGSRSFADHEQRPSASVAVVEDHKAGEKRKMPSESEEGEFRNANASLALRLWGDTDSFEEREDDYCEGKFLQRCKSNPGLLNHPICQVDDCNSNLNDARDYYRRHKVCEKHAKSKKVLLGGILQRFCQQCSRFHLLQEFDEEKRSCRKRLAGHNRRRRKNTLDTILSSHSIKDDQISRCILVCLMKILTNLHSKNSDQSKDQVILLQLLQRLSSSTGISEPDILSELGPLLAKEDGGNRAEGTTTDLSTPQKSQAVPESPAVVCSNMAASSGIGNPGVLTTADRHKPMDVARDVQAKVSLPSIDLQDPNALWPKSGRKQMQQPVDFSLISPIEAKVGEQAKPKINDFDLNSSYNECQNSKTSERVSQSDVYIPHIGHTDFPLWPNQDIPQTSPICSGDNSESMSDRSHSSSAEDVRFCTDRIIFKLFGKDPSDLPLVLREQILSWLSHSPTDIESYIKPGCIVLTIYIRSSMHVWKELWNNLTMSLKKLVEASDDVFWKTGWVCADVGYCMAFIYNGQVLLEMPVLRSQGTPLIASVVPIALDLTEEVTFRVKGWNLSGKNKKLLCAFHGDVHEIGFDPKELNDSSCDSFECLEEYNEVTQTFSFTSSLSKTFGRGFIEVEDHGLGCGFFPFIVAEPEICLELRTLESSIEITGLDSNDMRSRNQSIEFLMEFGWLLERRHLLSRTELKTFQNTEFFNKRFRWLLEFSLDHDWCAVVKKILDALFNERIGGSQCSVDQLLNAVNPLHQAVRRNCRSIVDLLLRYTPENNNLSKSTIETGFSKKIFRSSMQDPAGITPLHIAACIEGAGDVLNLLTDDPNQEWLQTWENFRDGSGFTPEDYARQRGHGHYIDLVQRKKKSKDATQHTTLDMSKSWTNTKRVEESPSMAQESYHFKKQHAALNINSRSMELSSCRACEKMSAYISGHRSLSYRPAILSMVAIAAVCVCVGLLLKSPPEVLYVVAFRWERLQYGFI